MNDAVTERRLRQLLFTLVVVLTFEGIVRKASPMIFSVPLFLLKDVLVVIMGYYVFQMPSAPALAFLSNAYKGMVILFMPLIFVTAWHDPLLAVFGAKQYLLYPIVAFATFYAFQNVRMAQMLACFRWISLLVIPTAVMALIELRLPHDNWLNLSVEGGTMESFMAAGELRVSSTFSFEAQYCAFLNVEAFCIMIALHDWRKRSMAWKITLLSLLPILVFSSFITGSRAAVVGNTAIVMMAAVLALMKFQVRPALQIGAVLISLYLATQVVHYVYPEATAAYSARENGRLIGISDEIQQRVLSTFYISSRDRAMLTFFGNGLGIMSNGSDTFSDYAALWRANLWTESDFGSTIFEGGFYLVILWYGFRFYVIFVTTKRFLGGITKAYSVPVSFNQAFVIILGTVATLGIQPPTAIWWWFGVGTSLIFWWKCVGPPESEIEVKEGKPQPVKLVRGRSLYADVLHPPK